MTSAPDRLYLHAPPCEADGSEFTSDYLLQLTAMIRLYGKPCFWHVWLSVDSLTGVFNTIFYSDVLEGRLCIPFEAQIITNDLKTIFWSWRNDPAVKSTCDSSRETKSDPSTYMEQFITTCTSSSRASHSLFWPLFVHPNTENMHTYNHTCINKIKYFKRLYFSYCKNNTRLFFWCFYKSKSRAADLSQWAFFLHMHKTPDLILCIANYETSGAQKWSYTWLGTESRGWIF